MCGIAGVVNLREGSIDPDLLSSMASALAHRGPDDCGVYDGKTAGLSHARLSVIDIASGQQPMSLPDRTLWITFNGEIFNYIELREQLRRKGHTFTTQSDTEVLLHLYLEKGEEFVNDLNGQWAFAIWDTRQQKLFLSRDRMGIRPLFYTQTPTTFLFASEIKALLASSEVSLELDLRALSQIFTFWVTLPHYSAFKGINQLPPGHSLTLQHGRLRVWKYWQLEYRPLRDTEGRSEGALAEELRALVLDSIRLRLRSDVPVGAYLSGGLDSTVITALTRTLVGDRLKTFSISFDDPEFDESTYQMAAVDFLGTQHTGVHCCQTNIASVFPEVVWHTEQPIIRTAPGPLFLLAKSVRDAGFKVVLTGEGADEVLGGYDIFKEAKIRQFWGRNPTSSLRPLLLKRLYPYMNSIQQLPEAYRRSFFHVTPDDLASPFFSHLPRWRQTANLKVFLSRKVRAETQSYNPISDLERMLPCSFREWDTFNQAEYLETMHLLPGYILSSQGDRMAMAHGVEGRYPFLDHRIVEFAASLPPTLKMKVLDQKHLLKRMARGMIPESIRKRAKQPYRAPDAKSFLGAAPPYVEELLSEDTLRRDEVFDPHSVRSLMAKLSSGRTVGTKENMAFVGILSTQILIDKFIHRHAQ